MCRLAGLSAKMERREILDSPCRRSTLSKECSSITRSTVPRWTMISGCFYGFGWRISPDGAGLTSQKTGWAWITLIIFAAGLVGVSAWPQCLSVHQSYRGRGRPPPSRSPPGPDARVLCTTLREVFPEIVIHARTLLLVRRDAVTGTGGTVSTRKSHPLQNRQFSARAP